MGIMDIAASCGMGIEGDGPELRSQERSVAQSAVRAAVANATVLANAMGERA